MQLAIGSSSKPTIFVLQDNRDQWRSQTCAHPGLGPGTSVWKKLTIVLLQCSLFAMLPYTVHTFGINTDDNLYCVHVHQSHGSELLLIQDRWLIKNSLKYKKKHKKKQQQRCAVPRRINPIRTVSFDLLLGADFCTLSGVQLAMRQRRQSCLLTFLCKNMRTHWRCLI